MADVIYGRDFERSSIGELLDGARVSRSAVLVVLGEAGIGKSALLEDAREQADGLCVLDASGVEFEAHLPFAALHQLLRPILGLLERLPEPQARALGEALGVAAGGGEDRFLISLGALSLLVEAAERQPLLCLIDDAHLLDDASADALGFVARRLEAEGIVMIFAARTGESARLEGAGFPELRLGGLDPRAAATLIDQRAGGTLPPEIRDRLLTQAEGNPLALLELSSSLSVAQLSGAEPVFGLLPVSARVERAFLARLGALSEQARTLLLVAAADDTGELGTVLRAAASLGVDEEALDDAERAGLLQVRGNRVSLRHPLVRSAVYQAAPLFERRVVHRTLAEVLGGAADADRRAWHRAAASVEPDPSVVEELEQAAERARRRSAFAAASLALERAAALVAEGAPRVRRLTDAAANAWLGGRIERASALLGQARSLGLEPIGRADIDYWRGLIELNCGTPANAYRLLFDAAQEVAPLDGERALQLLNLASLAALYAGNGAAAVEIAGLASTLEVERTPLVRMLLQILSGLGSHFQDDFARAADSLADALAIEERIRRQDQGEQPFASILFAGRAAIFLSDDDRGYPLHQEAAAHARATGALGLLAQILPRLAHMELRFGRPASASANAAEGLRLARELGQHDLVAYELVVQALIAGFYGAQEDCQSRAAQGRELADTRGSAFVIALADWALLLLELGLGRSAEAFHIAREIPQDRTAEFLAALDRIEAAIHAAEPEVARNWLDAFERWAQAGGAPWARAVATHAHALLSPNDQEAERLFQTALAIHDEGTRPFERARTELAYGQFLRRRRRRVDARAHLHAALAEFERLGAHPWAGRARLELRASGQVARKRDPSTRGDLTPQELQIASFVAQGLSNRDVAAQLFLSPRTIDFHLRNIFRKLDISSRTQLARLDLDAINPTIRHAA